jgi:hypothetical protein
VHFKDKLFLRNTFLLEYCNLLHRFEVIYSKIRTRCNLSNDANESGTKFKWSKTEILAKLKFFVFKAKTKLAYYD